MSYIKPVADNLSPFCLLLTDSSDSNYLTSPHFSSSSTNWLTISGSYDVTLTTPGVCYFEALISWEASAAQPTGIGYFNFTFYKFANNATTAANSHMHSIQSRAGLNSSFPTAGFAFYGGDDAAYAIAQTPTFYFLQRTTTYPWSQKITNRCNCVVRRLS